jgi:anti-sigma factor RsiW
MNCAEIHPLLHAYVDNELDLVHTLDVQRHLETCFACKEQKNSLDAMRSSLRDSNLAFRAPASLRNQVRQMIGASGGEGPSRAGISSALLWKWLAFGSMAFAVLTILLRPMGNPGSPLLADEAVSAHVRSLMADHLMDVASTDQHTVKPWFDGKLDFAPDVKDFAAQGFPLVGGRLDYLNGRAVAALIYRRNKHPINVFVWPVGNASQITPKTEIIRGYSVIDQDVNGLHYCLVSDLNGKELGDLAGLLGK